MSGQWYICIVEWCHLWICSKETWIFTQHLSWIPVIYIICVRWWLLHNFTQILILSYLHVNKQKLSMLFENEMRLFYSYLHSYVYFISDNLIKWCTWVSFCVFQPYIWGCDQNHAVFWYSLKMLNLFTPLVTVMLCIMLLKTVLKYYFPSINQTPIYTITDNFYVHLFMSFIP